jgi:uncharacterized protein (DUF849 family)
MIAANDFIWGTGMTPLVIEAAINGMTPRTHNPHVPKTPHEVAADAIECLDAGATVIHSHIEQLSILGRPAADEYIAAYRAIVAARPDAILCPTAGAGGTLNERWAHTEMIEYLLDLMGRHRLGPSIAVYDPSYLQTTLAYHKAGRLPPGAMVKIYFAGDHNFADFKKGGFKFFSMNPTRKAFDAYVEMLEGSGLAWCVAVPGGDVTATGMARLAIKQGGHVRIGLEDHAGDSKPSNRELIEQVVAIARAVDRPIATSAQAAEIMGLPRR